MTLERRILKWEGQLALVEAKNKPLREQMDQEEDEIREILTALKNQLWKQLETDRLVNRSW